LAALVVGNVETEAAVKHLGRTDQARDTDAEKPKTKE
jgi:hypothetical protein